MHLKLSLLYFALISVSLTLQDEVSLNPQISVRGLGVIEGTVGESLGGRKFYSFEGVPYGKPPTGDLRFQKSQEFGSWTGIWKANKIYVCLQYHHMNPKNSEEYAVEGQEDCLYVNIYTPTLNPEENLDVLVYIHGGSFMFNYGGLYGPKFLMDKNLVYVSINYRLGPLGFLSTQSNLVPGNNGVKDQILALTWIQKHIKNFGGNPDSVTISGASAGGASVHIHYLTEKSRNLFHKGIIKSGAVLNPWVLTEKPLEKARKLANVLGCASENLEVLINCLRTRPGEQIVASVKYFQNWMYNPFTPFGVVVDSSWASDPVFKDHPYKLLKEQKFKDAPTMFSYTDFEGLYPGWEFYQEDHLKALNSQWNKILPHILFFNDTIKPEFLSKVSQDIKKHYHLSNQKISRKNFPDFIEILSDRIFLHGLHKSIDLQARIMKSPVYFYYFTHSGADSYYANCLDDDFDWFKGAGHYADVPFIFQVDAVNTTSTKRDRDMVKVFQEIHSTFAKSGRPEISGVDWTELDKTGQKWTVNGLQISSPSDLQMVDLVYKNHEFWESLAVDEDEGFEVTGKDEL